MKIFLVICLSLLPLAFFAANFTDLPTPEVQPDGSVLELWASGDEFANRLHDAEGYTVMQSPTDGYYYYALRLEGEPAPSSWRADSSNPRALGLEPGINISPQRYRDKVQFMRSHARSDQRGPNLGTVNNLVVFIRFSDQTEFADPRSVYDAKFNADDIEAYSLRNYFHRVSYDQLNYVSHHFPTCAPETNLSYQDSHPRAYYLPYNAVTNPLGYRDYQRTDREHALLANAIDAIAGQVPASLNIDADNDDYVDNVCFIIRGPHSAWNDLLWAHRWALYTEDAYINGKLVWDFTFQPENQNSVRTLCHEMFHSVGAPDLYHYNFDGMTPTGCWDIMESGNGHMGMYMKTLYGGWIDTIPVIGPGTYTLHPVTEQNNSAFRVPLSGTEYLVLEYRRQNADIFEESLPGSGLLIYRINPSGSGNAQGPPDEVYIYRPDGTTDSNGRIAEAAFSAQNFQAEFNQFTDPACHLTYGTPFPVNIHSIGTAGHTITFTLGSVSGNLPPVISDLDPAQGEVLTPGDHAFSAMVSAPGDDLDSVEFWIDGQMIGQTWLQPYTTTIPDYLLTVGYHDLEVRATTTASMSSAKQVRIRVVDPQQQTWFSWLSDEPVWSDYGRGAVPIKAAVIYDLGTQEYVVKKIRFHAIADPWGFPAVPGLVNAKINRFAAAAITNQTLLQIGDIMCPLDGWFEYTVNSNVPLTGQIAVILDLFEYQNIMFDANAPCGYSWLTEPNRPWTDALGRGMVGAAAIELQLQAPNVTVDEDLSPQVVSSFRISPNPFREAASFSFSLKSAQPVELNIYNLRGQQVARLLASKLGAGEHQVAWDGLDSHGSEAAGGIYLYRMKAGKSLLTGKLLRLP